jgi:hypothetical protein
MAVTTYTNLVAAVVEYLARDQDTTLTARIPDFITLCEAKLNRILHHPRMEKRSTSSVDTGNDEPEFITLPTDFQSMRRVRLSGVAGKPRLEYMAQSQLEDYRYTTDDVPGQPAYYTIMGDEMELAPTPGEDYAIEMVYRANLAALSGSNATNWLIDLAPDVYLYGVLLEAAAYTKGMDDMLPVWSSAFTSAVEQLGTHGHRQSVDAGPSTVWLPGCTP